MLVESKEDAEVLTYIHVYYHASTDSRKQEEPASQQDSQVVPEFVCRQIAFRLDRDHFLPVAQTRDSR